LNAFSFRSSNGWNRNRHRVIDRCHDFLLLEARRD
jgi:hypothetical protein